MTSIPKVRALVGALVSLLLTAGVVNASVKGPPAVNPTHPLIIPLSNLSLTTPCGTSTALPPAPYQADGQDTGYQLRGIAHGVGLVSLNVGLVGGSVAINSPTVNVPFTVDLNGAASGPVQISTTISADSCPGPGLTVDGLNWRVGP